MNCKFCNKICKNDNSCIQHQLLCKLNPNRRQHSGGPKKGNKPWNKGLTKETDIRVKIQGENLHKKYENNELIPSWLGRKHTDEQKQKIALKGGYREGSGRGKSGWYKGYYCDSSWELAFVIYNLEHDIKFERNKKQFAYIFEGKRHNYIPDWIVNNEYVEIKGYWTEQWQAKLEQFPKEETLIVLTKIEMQHYIDYVIEKYGKDYINLYE